jgi:drug/metabolite transporter (DMT)-like permease
LPERRAREGWVIALLLYTVVVWGANVVMIKLMAAHFEAVHLSAIRTMVAFVFIAGLARLTGFRPQRLDRSQFLGLSAAAALMVYAHQILLTQGLAWSSATNGGLALSLNPLLSVLLGAVLFGERLGALGAAGVVMGLGGAAVVILNRSGAELRFHGTGDALLLLSMLVYVAAGAFVRKLSQRMSPVAIAYHMHLIGAAMLAVHAALLPGFWDADAWTPGIGPWVLIFASALFSTAIGGLGWSYGISRLGLGRTAVFLNLLPVSTLATAVLFLDETLRPEHAIGFALVLAGTWLAVHGRRAIAAEPVAP